MDEPKLCTRLKHAPLLLRGAATSGNDTSGTATSGTAPSGEATSGTATSGEATFHTYGRGTGWGPVAVLEHRAERERHVATVSGPPKEYYS